MTDTCDRCGEAFDPNLTSTSLNGMHAACEGDAAWRTAEGYWRDREGIEHPDCKLSTYDLREIDRAARHIREFMGDWLDSYKAVINEECAGDEKHCTCVPHLRRYITTLEAKARAVAETIDGGECWLDGTSEGQDKASAALVALGDMLPKKEL